MPAAVTPGQGARPQRAKGAVLRWWHPWTSLSWDGEGAGLGSQQDPHFLPSARRVLLQVFPRKEGQEQSWQGPVPCATPLLLTLQPPSLLPSPLCSCLFLSFHLCSHHDFPSLSPPRTPSPCLISGYQGRLDFFNYGSVCLRCLQAWPSSRAGSDVPACSLSAWLHLFIPRSLAFFALLEI